MDEILNFLQNEPAALALLAVLAATLALFFTLPALSNRLKRVRLPALPSIAKGSPKKGETPPEDKKDFRFKVKPNPKTIRILIPVAIVIAIGAVGGGYLAYDFFVPPVRVVGAAQFKLEKGKNISQLQNGGLAAWPQAKLYLLDIRSRRDYAEEHLVGSASLPTEKAIEGAYPIEGVVIAVYSNETSVDEAREVADAIIENGESGRIKYNEKIGKIYVIKNGYEGLKNQGLITEVGGWD